MEKQKKFYKRWWFLVIVIVVIAAIASQSGDNESKDVAEEPAEQVNTTIIDGPEKIKQKEPEEESDKDNIPREYRNALRAAQNYVDIMPFSKQGLFDQLTSEYGDQYPVEAAQYAIENVKVDYNEEALEAAKSYLETMPMSDKELFEQLTSEYGDQFTEEQAQYAIDNLPE